jgi:hypothetical protein
MTDDTAPPAIRPEGCQAVPFGAFTVCERCGIAWDPNKPPAPKCGAMSFGRIRERLFKDTEAAVDEHDHLVRMRAAGTPADPLPALKRSMEWRAIVRLVDRVTDSEAILDILNPNAEKRELKSMAAGRISDAQLIEIKGRHPCDVVAGGMTTLRRGGKLGQVGACPICAKNKSSKRATEFECNAEGWVCAKCGDGGDVIKLIRKVTGKDFHEAIEYLGGAARSTGALGRDRGRGRRKRPRNAIGKARSTASASARPL